MYLSIPSRAIWLIFFFFFWLIDSNTFLWLCFFIFSLSSLILFIDLLVCFLPGGWSVNCEPLVIFSLDWLNNFQIWNIECPMHSLLKARSFGSVITNETYITLGTLALGTKGGRSKATFIKSSVENLITSMRILLFL